MRTIHKYPVPALDNFTIEMPAGARLLSVQTQRDEPVLWALVDTEARLVKRAFHLRGTGHDAWGIADDCAFVGTFQLTSGRLVFHLFDKGDQ